MGSLCGSSPSGGNNNRHAVRNVPMFQHTVQPERERVDYSSKFKDFEEYNSKISIKQ